MFINSFLPLLCRITLFNSRPQILILVFAAMNLSGLLHADFRDLFNTAGLDEILGRAGPKSIRISSIFSHNCPKLGPVSEWLVLSPLEARDLPFYIPPHLFSCSRSSRSAAQFSPICPCRMAGALEQGSQPQFQPSLGLQSGRPPECLCADPSPAPRSWV